MGYAFEQPTDPATIDAARAVCLSLAIDVWV